MRCPSGAPQVRHITVCKAGVSEDDALDLVERHLLAAAVVEFGGADAGVARQLWQPIRVATPAAAARRPIIR